ncbi:extradiol ring-cleavage dioxygenase [Enemella dayhoffiae]|uniref:Extradiol ring-cleavage dioxygenase n=1 Tax=Enemella dayhoffiae TaxID=2016507 RepID=A0A255GR98_9ACTN|nr:VOC family protein [Enemella dayhoffiae]OYO18335.1 extradiol ring-cleavage dioxygenase [Enemella dayhoffiae]
MRYSDEPVVRLRGLRSVTLRVPEPERSKDFYHQVWGLGVSDSDDQRFWLRGTGQEHHILKLEASEQNALGGVSFAVGTPSEVDEAARRLEALGIPLLRTPGRHDEAAGGYSCALVDPEGRVIELAADVNAVVHQDVNGYASVPRQLAHVVLNTTDIDTATAFYTQVLGMRVSDWSEHQMAFLRCTPKHHVIAFNQAPWASINHVAYELTSIDHFMRGIGNLKVHGIEPKWGPGRHGPGNNTFSYFTDPAGLVCEYTSEVEEINEDTWLCRTWRRTPELSDQWRTAGPPSAGVRSAMAGVADPGARGLVNAETDYFLAADNGDAETPEQRAASGRF